MFGDIFFLTSHFTSFSMLSALNFTKKYKGELTFVFDFDKFKYPYEMSK